MIDSPVVSVHIPVALRSLSGGYAEVTASGDTVGDILEAVGREYPAIRTCLMADDGSLRSGVAVFLGSHSIRDRAGLQTPIDLEEVVSIVPTA